MAESFFGSLKTDLIYRHTWTSRHDAELAIFAWIEGWYNPERIIVGLECAAQTNTSSVPRGPQSINLDTTVRVGNLELSLH
jgi:hypothetical protein